MPLCAVPPHQSTPEEEQSKEVSVSGRNDDSTKNVHNFSCVSDLGVLQVCNDIT